jgi:integrase
MRTVETTSGGRYKVRFRHAGRQSSETFDTKREAQRFAKWLDALGPQGALDQLYESEQDATVQTLSEVAADYIQLRANTTDGTRLNYERLWARTWGPLVGHLPANRVTEDHLSRAVMTLGKTYSRKSLENQRGLLSGVMGRAVRLGYLTENIARGLPLPAGKHADQAEMRIITPAEFVDIIAKFPAHYQPLARFLYGTGCRWGEAVALQVQDVNLPNVRIRRALKWSPDNKRVVGTTKTKKSNRTVVVGDVMLDDLRAACEGKAGDELVFTAHRGGPVLHRTFWSRYWLPAVQHLRPRPRIHDLRHSHASVLLGAGVPIHVVQARLGHESIKTTVDTYSSLLPDAQMMAARAASLAFGPNVPELD